MEHLKGEEVQQERKEAAIRQQVEMQWKWEGRYQERKKSAVQWRGVHDMLWTEAARRHQARARMAI